MLKADYVHMSVGQNGHVKNIQYYNNPQRWCNPEGALFNIKAILYSLRERPRFTVMIHAVASCLFNQDCAFETDFPVISAEHALVCILV